MTKEEALRGMKGLRDFLTTHEPDLKQFVDANAEALGIPRILFMFCGDHPPNVEEVIDTLEKRTP